MMPPGHKRGTGKAPEAATGEAQWRAASSNPTRPDLLLR